MVSTLHYRELMAMKENRDKVVAEIEAEFAEKFKVIEEAKRVAIERRLIDERIAPLDLDDMIEKEREVLQDAIEKYYAETGAKSLDTDHARITLVERDKCDVIKAKDWDELGGPESTDLTYTAALYEDIRTLVAADAFEFLKINAVAALAKAIPSFLAKGHKALNTVRPIKDRSIQIKLNK